MERVSDEWLDEAIPKYSAIDSKGKGANVYLALCELRARRQMEDEQGELVVASTFMAIKTAEILQLLKKAEKEHGHTDNSEGKKDGAGATQEKPVLPIPCTKGFENWTVKDYFQKINEELDEMKNAILSFGVDLDCSAGQVHEFVYDDIIAEEAADTITAITSMLEAMGIDEQQRQAAQKLVNEHNRERNRL